MTKEEKAKHLGEAIAIDMFLTLLNPDFRGKNFTWSKLSNIVNELASSYASFDNLDINIASKTASDMAERCLNQSGIEQWMPL